MRHGRLLIAGLLCGCTAVSLGHPACRTDGDCSAGQLCFVDGCGDPGKGLFVEVIANASGGAQAQDFAVNSLEGSQALQLFPPSSLVGQVTQPPLGPYLEVVDFFAIGYSALIPGLQRGPFESTLDLQSRQGNFQLPVATGIYDVAITATQDATIPPVTLHGIVINPGDTFPVPIQFPVTQSAQKVTGTLYYLGNTSSLHSFEAQAFDRSTGDPLSQPAAVVGTPTPGQGNFTLWVGAGSPNDDSFVLVMTPADPTSAPSKAFLVPWVSDLTSVLADMGGYGSPVLASGTLLGPDQKPVAGAAVFTQGSVGGDGLYQSPAALTDAYGAFTLRTLASPPDGGLLQLWAVPPSGISAGVLAGVVTVQGPTTTYDAGTAADAGAIADLGTFTCPRRLQLNGTVQNPDAGPAPGATVTLNLIATATNSPFPSTLPQAVTDSSGNFSFALDPALYRIDVVPSDPSLPHASWFWPTESPLGNDGGIPQPPDEIYELSEGKTLHGTVSTEQMDGGLMQPTGGAVVHFFRVSAIQGQPVSYPLADGTANADGTYAVVLPTH